LALQALREDKQAITTPLTKFMIDPQITQLINLLDNYLKQNKLKLEEFMSIEDHRQKFYQIAILQSIDQATTIEFLSLTMDSVFTVFNLRKHSPSHLYIKTLCVSEIANKLGYGKYILSTLLNLSFLEQSQYLGFNFSKVSLHTTPSSYKFYLKQGFHQSADGIHCYKPPSTTYKMRYELDKRNAEYLMTKPINFTITHQSPRFKPDYKTFLTIVVD
jgi:hypothetical protein